MSKIVDDLIAKTISSEMMEQYEKIRQTNVVNMFNYHEVVRYASAADFKELAEISFEDYKTLLLNFQQLMKHYDIKQPRKEK